MELIKVEVVDNDPEPCRVKDEDDTEEQRGQMEVKEENQEPVDVKENRYFEKPEDYMN
ncbi:hypothetical protein F2P79_025623 [Pimephales promelas]|nr:hypothetical protein F2P79_025623 [Pimephales promelas]